jgi:hypothetical protein
MLGKRFAIAAQTLRNSCTEALQSLKRFVKASPSLRKG